MIDGSTALGARVLERLRSDRVIWMTTVDRGAPQPAPVWFLYERGESTERIIVFSKTKKLPPLKFRNVKALTAHCSIPPQTEDFYAALQQMSAALVPA